jgi:outer membrane protein assembly factor BamD
MFNSNVKDILFPFLILSILFIVSCSGKSATKPEETFDPEKAFMEANALLEKADYEKAREVFVEIKNKDTSKKFAPFAQLRIADSYIKEDESELGIAEYKKFLDAYPDNQYAPYAQYQIGMVYFGKIEDVERGYSWAEKALKEFEGLKKMFPRNPYRDVLDLRIEKCKNIMAEYEFLVGRFYYKKGSYNAAVGRFEVLMKEYPGYSKEADVLFYTGMSYKNLGQKDKASEYLTSLIEKYPDNRLVAKAKKELADLKL